MKAGLSETIISAPTPTKAFEQVLNNLNDIGRFYEVYSEEEAIQGVVTHIQDFIAPSIRRQIVAHLHHGGVGMKTIVQQAVGRLKEAAEYPDHKSQNSPCKSFAN